MAAETATETRRPVKRAIHLMMENHDAASTIYGRFPGAKTGMKTAQDDSLGVSGWVLERSSDTWTWRTADGEPPFRDTSDRPALCV
jgi:hypothetical protein